MIIHATYETVDAIGSPGDGSGCVIETTAEALPVGPEAIVPFVPESIIGPFDETIQTTCIPGSDSRPRSENATHVLPGGPG